MIEKIEKNWIPYDIGNREYFVSLERNLMCTNNKLNEVIDYLNSQRYEGKRIEACKEIAQEQEKREYEKREPEPKWKVGDTYWFIDEDLKIVSASIPFPDHYLLRKDCEPKLLLSRFDSRKQAEAALAEIKEVLRRHQ